MKTWERIEAIDAAILAGLARAERSGLTKPGDIAVTIRLALEGAGLKIIRKPGKTLADVLNGKGTLADIPGYRGKDGQ